MSDYRKRILPLILLLGVVATTTADAQVYQPFGPLLGEEFDHDWQIFAPAEISSFGGGPDPNYGLFTTYDRMHVGSGRSNETPAPFEGDWAYGNRFNFGYMTEDDHGWLMEVMKVSEFQNGPGAYTQLTSVEVMKQWRHKPLHHGGIVETFLGGRYSVVKHSSTSFTGIPSPETDLDIENNIYGAQAGLKWYKKKGRWTISTQGRYYYGYNDQHYSQQIFVTPGIKQHRWVHSGDIRAEVNYDITKSFAISLGCQFLYFGNGIARGVAIGNNDQDAYFAGTTFGFQFNR